MENMTRIRLELEVSAQKIIAQYMTNNEQIAKEIEAGVKKAFDELDLEELIKKEVIGTVKRAVSSSSGYGKIYTTIRQKIEEYIDDRVQNIVVQALKEDTNDQTNSTKDKG